MISFEDIEFQKIQKLLKENLDLKQELTEIHSENERLKERLKRNLNDDKGMALPDIPDPFGKTHDFFELIVEMANSLIIHWDANGTLNYVNDYTLRFFGYTKEEIIGKSSRILVPETVFVCSESLIILITLAFGYTNKFRFSISNRFVDFSSYVKPTINTIPVQTIKSEECFIVLSDS
jgi:PAS domain-containing protein